MGGAIGLQCPYLHLTETLAAELGLAAQGLLRNQGVRAGGPCVNFIFHQMNQLQDIHIAHRYRLVKRLTAATITQDYLAGNRRRQVKAACRLVHCFLQLIQAKLAGGHPLLL